MRQKIIYILLMVVFCRLIQSQSDLAPEEIYDASKDAITSIYAYNEDGTFKSKGSGVIVSGDGLVYTNYHVIQGSDSIGVEVNNNIIKQVIIVGFDETKDAAILKLPDNNYSFIKLNNCDSLRIGQVVYAIGNPQGLKKAISNGILSRYDYYNEMTYLQYSAPISPGSSGGALLNSKGELIGITSSYYPNGQNLNLAVPVYEFNNLFKIDYNDFSQINLMKNLFCRCSETTSLKEECIDEVLSKISLYIKEERNDYEFMGRSYSRLAEYDSAILYYNKALELDPNCKELYALRGDAYSFQFKDKEVLSDYEKALALDSNYLEVYFKRAYYYDIVKGDYKKAIIDYNKVTHLKPDYDLAYVEKANCYLKMHDTNNAITGLANCLWDINKNDGIFYKRGRIYYQLGMYEEAINDYNIAISIDKTVATYYFSRAVAFSRNGMDYLAIRDYEEYMKLLPGTNDAYNNMGYCYMDDENYQLAEYFFLKSVKYNRREFDSYIGLSILNFRQGKIKNTIKYMAKAIENRSDLVRGFAGLRDIEKTGYFWERSEISDIKKIFKIMGVKSVKSNGKIKKRPDLTLGAELNK